MVSSPHADPSTGLGAHAQNLPHVTNITPCELSCSIQPARAPPIAPTDLETAWAISVSRPHCDLATHRTPPAVHHWNVIRMQRLDLSHLARQLYPRLGRCADLETITAILVSNDKCEIGNAARARRRPLQECDHNAPTRFIMPFTRGYLAYKVPKPFRDGYSHFGLQKKWSPKSKSPQTLCTE